MDCCKQLKDFDQQSFKRYIHDHPWLKNKVGNLVDRWLKVDWPIFYDESGIISFHAPVGNVDFFEVNKSAQIIISGFCVAKDAGFSYVKTSLEQGKLNDKYIAAKHTFDTNTMKRGIVRLFEDNQINLLLDCSCADEVFMRAKNGEIPLMLTQALCPIIVDGSSRAEDVWEAIHANSDLRIFISRSLTRWWKSIKECSTRNTVLYLMGKRQRGRAELVKLLAYSRVKDNDSVEITDCDQKNESLLALIKAFMNIKLVYHAVYYGRFGK